MCHRFLYTVPETRRVATACPIVVPGSGQLIMSYAVIVFLLSGYTSDVQAPHVEPCPTGKMIFVDTDGNGNLKHHHHVTWKQVLIDPRLVCSRYDNHWYVCHASLFFFSEEIRTRPVEISRRTQNTRRLNRLGATIAKEAGGVGTDGAYQAPTRLRMVEFLQPY